MIRAVRVAENRATSGAGAKIIAAQGPSFTGCAFVRNEAGTNGGGLKADYSTFALEECRIDSNGATAGGGALWLQGSDAELSRCLVRENSSANGAGGLRVSSTTLLVAGGEITGNGQGVVVGTPGPADADARGVWWGDPSGPYHPTLNPQGLGNAVSDHVLFVPWETPTGVASGGPRASFALVAGSPVTSGSAITFSIEGRSEVTLRAYDVAGRLVTTLFDGPAGSGATHLFWDGRDDRGRPAPSGVYFVRLSTAAHTLTRRVVLVH